MIRFGEEPWDEVFITQEAAAAGVTIENTGGEPLVSLRYFAPQYIRICPRSGRTERSEQVGWVAMAHRNSPLPQAGEGRCISTNIKGMTHDRRTPQQLSQAAQRRLAGPGGKGDGGEPPIALDTMLDLTAAAEFEGVKFDGFDIFLYHPHFNIDGGEDEIHRLEDKARARNLAVGTVVAPVYAGTGRRLGDGH